MADEDFACETFAPQKWRKDMCRNCYQPLKMHKNKPPSPSVSPKPLKRTPSGGSSPKSAPKVFQRFQVDRKPSIDKSIPAKERTAAPVLEGIQPGTVKKIHEVAPTLKTRDPPKLPGTTPGATPQAATESAGSNTPEKAPSPLQMRRTSIPEKPPTPSQASPKPLVKSTIQKPPPPVVAGLPARPKPPPQPKPKSPPTPRAVKQKVLAPPVATKEEKKKEEPMDRKVEESVPVKPITPPSPPVAREENTSNDQSLPSAAIKVDTSDDQAQSKVEESVPTNVEPSTQQKDESLDAVTAPDVSTEEAPQESVKETTEGELPTVASCEDTANYAISTDDAPLKASGAADEAGSKIDTSPQEQVPVDVPQESTVSDEISHEQQTESAPVERTEAPEECVAQAETITEPIAHEEQISEPAVDETTQVVQPPSTDSSAPDECVVDPIPQSTEPDTSVSEDNKDMNIVAETDQEETNKSVNIEPQESKVTPEAVETAEVTTSVAQEDKQQSQTVEIPTQDKEEFVVDEKKDLVLTENTELSTQENPESAPPVVAETIECAPPVETLDAELPVTNGEGDSSPNESPVDTTNDPAVDEATSSTELAEEEVKSKEPTEDAEPDETEQVTAEGTDGVGASRPKRESPQPQGEVPPLPPGAPPPPPPPPILPPAPTYANNKSSAAAARGATLDAIANGGVTLKSVPPQEERQRPPPVSTAHAEAMEAIRGGISLKSVPPQEKRQRPPPVSTAHAEAMEAIRGGISLKSVPPPQERAVGEEKVVDVASELRMKVLKRKKQEAQSVSSGVDEHREEVTKMAAVLRQVSGTHSFIHQLKTLLHQVETLLEKVKIPPEVLTQRLQWPILLVDDLREVLAHMKELELKVVACENLCKQTLVGGGASSGSPASSWRVNPEAVERCVQDVVRLARNLATDESRYFRASTSFPIDATDIQGLLMRAADAVAPLIDKLYEKAFAAHSSVLETTVSKFDLSFRIQNALRLLQLCCRMSDTLSVHLQVPRHACYSDAMLKNQELSTDFQNQLKIVERKGDWDSEEQLVLGKKVPPKPAGKPESSEMVKRVIACLTADGSLSAELREQITPELLAKMETSLINAAVATCKTQVIEGCVNLRNSVFAEDETALHKNDFLWLLQAITKGNHECLAHLVKSCAIPVNCRSTENGTTALHRAAQRGDLPTVACLIRLGADPLMKNTFNSCATDTLALKNFPPKNFAAKLEDKEPLFDLASYINSPSLSDVVLVAEDGARFHAHRLVLCAQSPVFKSMLDSDLWVESGNKEIPLPTLTGKVVLVLLQYLYTGRCLFPRDDLNLGIELMAAADQFLLDPMKAQCEQVLSEKIDQEVAVPLYHAAFRFSTPILLANTCNYVLGHYGDIEDPEHEALLHILDNAHQK